ncbi:MAG: cytochrome c biogenesis protein CcsA [Gammaproteobacteria bacterium]|nr:cytochrome c biogenesis protein CcsA [Gammaproteobacteria bacterium]
MNELVSELPWLWAGLVAYAVATVMAVYAVAQPDHDGALVVNKFRPFELPVLGLVAVGVLLLSVALAERWMRIGHGPFVNLFELLVSQLFSLGLIYALVYWRVPVLRPTAAVVLPIIWVLGLWVLMIEPTDSLFPPTYHNNWLWVHIGFGKVFLSFCLVGAGLAGIILLRRIERMKAWFSMMPSDAVLDNFAWRFMVLALIFDSLMLIAGAVWAQDAWGRFWAWDALETSAFLNWLAIALGIHVRFSYRIPRAVGAAVVVAVFVLAFFTYFGTPFFSEAAHKGVV